MHYYVGLFMRAVKKAYAHERDRFVFETGPGTTKNHSNFRIRDTRSGAVVATIPLGNSLEERDVAKRCYVLFRVCNDDFAEYNLQLQHFSTVFRTPRVLPQEHGMVRTPEEDCDREELRQQIKRFQRQCMIM